MSSAGKNITDSWITAKDGNKKLFTIRHNNWNEKLGVINSEQLALIFDLQKSTWQPKEKFENITLQDFLKNSAKYGQYINLKTPDLSNDFLDQKISIRFQTAFYPVGTQEKSKNSTESAGKLEFTNTVYNYQGRTTPQNLVLLCTSEGLSIHTDNSHSAKNIYQHSISKLVNSFGDQTSDQTLIQNNWLKMSRSDVKVGQNQAESQTSQVKAQYLGIKSMGQRFNSVMTVQIPVINYEMANNMPYRINSGSSLFSSSSGFGFGSGQTLQFQTQQTAAPAAGGLFGAAPQKISKSSAAQISTGSFQSLADKLPDYSMYRPLVRHPTQHITVTVVTYYAIHGDYPTEKDVLEAIDDLQGAHDK